MAGYTDVAPPTDESSIAQWVMTQTENVLSNVVNAPMQALFDALLPVVAVGLTLQFVAYAFALMHGVGGMSVTEFFKKAILVAIISAFFGAGGMYQNDIAKVMVAMPDDVAKIVTNTSSIASEVDRLQQETTQATQSMTGGDNKAWYDILPDSRQIFVSFLAMMIQMNAAIVGAVIAILLIACKVGMALLVAAGPIFIAALLFEPTKQLFNSWVAQALNYIFLALMAGLITGFLLELNVALIRMIATQTNAGAADLLSLLSAQLLVGIASVFVMIQIPGMAGALSGGFGAQMGLGSTASGAFSMLRISSMLRRMKVKK